VTTEALGSGEQGSGVEVRLVAAKVSK